ncbi:hypothetical protein P154DRAFT_217861 [Amniculicola lignicola CBS 123094]|uniref:Uncharacterized protein n=1 Tax=Amniculicola lignicola CBS 123094 TaxID=1392246 RepID=A0A6A5X240_9PLEO|nr:hypothetical protein P154DRAFT_217861 [Amniculicola lignicola CBS 123094]
MGDDEILRYLVGFCWDNILQHGISGLVLLDNTSQTVVKSPLGQGKADIDVERRIYERFKGEQRREHVVAVEEEVKAVGVVELSQGGLCDGV